MPLWPLHSERLSAAQLADGPARRRPTGWIPIESSALSLALVPRPLRRATPSRSRTGEKRRGDFYWSSPVAASRFLESGRSTFESNGSILYRRTERRSIDTEREYTWDRSRVSAIHTTRWQRRQAEHPLRSIQEGTVDSMRQRSLRPVSCRRERLAAPILRGVLPDER